MICLLCVDRTPKKVVIDSSASSSSGPTEKKLSLDKRHAASSKEQHSNSHSSSFKSKACNSDAEWKISSCSLQCIDQKDTDTVTDVPNKILLKLCSGTGASSQKSQSKIKKHASVNYERSKRESADTVVARDTHLHLNEVAEFKKSSPNRDDAFGPAPKSKSKVKKRSKSEEHGNQDSGSTKNLAVDTGSDLPLFYAGNKASPDKDGTVAHRTKPHSKMKKDVNSKIEDHGNRDGTSTEVLAIGKDSGNHSKSKVKKCYSSNSEEHGNQDSDNTKNLAVDTGSDLPLFYPRNKASPDKDGIVAHGTKPHSKMKKQLNSKIEDHGNRDGTSTEVLAIDKDSGTQNSGTSNAKNLAMDISSDLPLFYPGNMASPDKDGTVAHGTKPHSKMKKHLNSKTEDNGNRDGISTEVLAIGKDSGTQNSGSGNTKNLALDIGSDLPLFYPANKASPDKDGTVAQGTKPHSKMKKHKIEDHGNRDGISTEVSAIGKDTNLAPNQPSESKNFLSGKDDSVTPAQKPQLKVKNKISAKNKSHDTGNGSSAKTTVTSKGSGFLSSQLYELKKLMNMHRSHVTEQKTKVKKHDSLTSEERSAKDVTGVKIKLVDEGPGLPSNLPKCGKSSADTDGTGLLRQKAESNMKKKASSAIAVHGTGDSTNVKAPGTDKGGFFPVNQPAECKNLSPESGKIERLKTVESEPDGGFRHGSQSSAASSSTEGLQPSDNEIKMLVHKSEKSSSGTKKHTEATGDRHSDKHIQSKHKCHHRSLSDPRLTMHRQRNYRGIYHAAADSVGHRHNTTHQQRHASNYLQSHTESAAVSSVEKQRYEAISLATADSANHCSRQPETLQPQTCVGTVHRQTDSVAVHSTAAVQAENPKSKALSLEAGDSSDHCNLCPETLQPKRNDSEIREREVGSAAVHSTDAIQTEKRKSRVPSLEAGDSACRASQHAETLQPQMYASKSREHQVDPIAVNSTDTVQAEKPKNKVVSLTDYKKRKSDPKPTVASSSGLTKVSRDNPQYMTSSLAEQLIMSYTGVKHPHTAGVNSESRPLRKLLNPVEDCALTVIQNELQSEEVRTSDDIGNFELPGHSMLPTTQQQRGTVEFNKSSSHMVYNTTDGREIPLSRGTRKDQVVSNQIEHSVSECCPDYVETVDKENFTAAEKREEFTSSLSTGSENLFDIMMTGDINSKSGYSSNPLLEAELYDQRETAVGSVHSGSESDKGKTAKDAVEADDSRKLTGGSELQPVVNSSEATTTLHETVVANSDVFAEVEKHLDILIATEKREQLTFPLDKNKNLSDRKEPSFPASHILSSSQAVESDVNGGNESQFVSVGNEDISADSVLKGSRNDSVLTLSTTPVTNLNSELSVRTEDTSKTEISSSNDAAKAIELEICGYVSEVPRLLLEYSECSDNDGDTVLNCETVKGFQHHANEPNTPSSKPEEEMGQESVSQDVGNNEEDRDFGHDDLEESLNKAKLLVSKAKSLVLKGRRNDPVVTLSTTPPVTNLDSKLVTAREDTSKTEISSSNDAAKAIELEVCEDMSEVPRQLLEKDCEHSDDDADTVLNCETVVGFQHHANEPNMPCSKSDEETGQESLTHDVGNNKEDRDFGHDDLKESLNKAKVLVCKTKSLIVEAKQDVMKAQTVMDSADELHNSDVDDGISEDVCSVSKDTLNITTRVEDVKSDMLASSAEVRPHSKILNEITGIDMEDSSLGICFILLYV